MASARDAESIINCGYARVSIRILSRNTCGKTDEKLSRSKAFQKLFVVVPDYCPDKSYFEQREGRDSNFDRNCKKVLQRFCQKWHPPESRCEYMATFSMENWKQLPLHLKRTHTMSNCQGCLLMHADIQSKFPGYKCDKNAPATKYLTAAKQQAQMLTKSVKEDVARIATRKALLELNSTSTQTLGCTFTEAIVNYCPAEKVQKKQTDTERKRSQRKMLRKCRDHLASQMGENDAITVLAENQSLSSYKRIRLSQSFETPQQKKDRYEKHMPKQRKHSPNFDTVSWDKDKVQQDLELWPEGEKINWSKFAREHQINAKNGGQIVKEFAVEIGIDVKKLDGRAEGVKMRAKKLKMPGGEISVPCHKTAEQVKADWAEMIQSGRLTLGEPCAPYKLTKYTIVDGEIKKTEMKIDGRKIPLLDIRQKLLNKQEKYMRLHTDSELQHMSRSALTAILEIANAVYSDKSSDTELRAMVAELERTRTIGIWHDHATVLGQGYVLITAKVFYDPIVFKTQMEIEGTSQSTPNLQSVVEEPELHMLVVCSSSVDDQASLIKDRISCLKELSTMLHSTNGVEVKDKLLFFYGDKPAQQMERGTQQGGRYKCGSCGCESHMMDDTAYSFRCECRSLSDLQAIALAGKYGKQRGVVRPFTGMTTEQLQQELRARNVFHIHTTKSELQDELNRVLKGVQRVPTLLLDNPTQLLSDLNLQHYTILDCEPLHDLKGHLANLFTELPFVIDDQSLATECKQMIDIHLSKDKVTGADYRLAAIHLLALLRGKAASNVTMLLLTIVEISKILYAEDVERTPRSILRLHNLTWFHQELCRDTFKCLHKVSHQKFFGLYLHTLTCHASKQYELVCLKSCNAEHEERLFGQVKRIAENTSNRKPENILPNILLRLQAKAERRDIFTAYHSQSNAISKDARAVCTSENSVFEIEFIEQRLDTWQAHLEDIACYLLPGSVWWQTRDDKIEFFDGDMQPNFRPEGPDLLHFRSTTYAESRSRKLHAWKIIRENITLPTPRIKVYDTDGNTLSQKSFYNTTEPQTPQAMEVDISIHSPNNEDEETVFISDDLQIDVVEDAHTLEIPELQQPSKVSDDTSQPCDPTLPLPSVPSNSLKLSLHTKLANAFYKAFCPVHDQCTCNKLQKLDKLRHTIKNRKSRPSSSLVSEYNTVLAELQQKLMTLQRQIREEIRTYENTYFVEHSQILPNPESDSKYKHIIHRRNFISKLLQLTGVDL